MSLIAEWRASRERKRRADRYLTALLTPPSGDEISWLSALCGDRQKAERELIFMRRALGLIVAERDALDDRTASDVAHALAATNDAEARRSPETGREWVSRWRTYSAAMALRGQAESPAMRLAKVMLEGASVAHPSTEGLERAVQIVLSARAQANELLRDVFGVASLPDDVRPSALRH